MGGSCNNKKCGRSDHISRLMHKSNLLHCCSITPICKSHRSTDVIVLHSYHRLINFSIYDLVGEPSRAESTLYRLFYRGPRKSGIKMAQKKWCRSRKNIRYLYPSSALAMPGNLFEIVKILLLHRIRLRPFNRARALLVGERAGCINDRGYQVNGMINIPHPVICFKSPASYPRKLRRTKARPQRTVRG